MAGVGAPTDHEAFEIETAGMVLVSCEIRMRFTPSHLRTPVCIAPDRRNAFARFHYFRRSPHKDAPSVRMPNTIYGVPPFGGGRAVKSQGLRRSPEATLGATVAHPLRCRCLAVLADRVASPVEIARELGLEVSSVGYHVNALAEAGLIEEVGQRPVRGAVEHFYKAVVRPITTTEEEAELSLDKRLSFARTIWSLIAANATIAIEAGTLIERPEHHLTRVPLRVDEEGWLDLAEAYMELYERVYEIHEESVKRLGGESDDPGISVLSVLAFFETPEPPPTLDFFGEAPAAADQRPEGPAAP